jgi:phosphoglycerate dehydrogenase-like enzyme
MKVVVYTPASGLRPGLSENLRELIRQAVGENTVVFPSSREELLKEGGDATVLYGWLRKEDFSFFPKLRWLQSPSAGVEGQLYPALQESDIILTNAAGIHAPYCAEHAFALLLGLTRGIHRHVRNQIKRQWRVTPLIEIGGWTLGIIGMGGFGVHMAQRGKGLGMHVIAVDPYRADKPAVVDELVPIDRLPELLRQSDVLMIACPHTVETHHLINAETLKLIKPGAYLINVTRGGIVDESALVDALRDGRVAGAGLDVFEVEPLPEDSPLWDMENVIITPHAAGQSQHRPRPTIELFCDSIKLYLRRAPLRNVVDKELGF